MANFVLINPFEVPPQQSDVEFMVNWQKAANYFRTQPGFVSARLHRAVSPDPRFRFVNVAEWESPQAFQAAVTGDGFRALAGGAPANHPALYQVVKTI